MNKCTAKWLIVGLICFTPALIYAAKVGVLHFKAVGVMSSTADAVTELLVSELISYEHTVLNPAAMDAAAGEVLRCYESECAAEAGFKAQVERVIFGSLSKLGEKHIIQASVVNVSTREVIWSGSLAAKRAEDLDMVAKRLAKAIAEGKKPEEIIEVGMITEEEEKEPMRRKIFHTAGFKAGGLLPTAGYAESGLMYHVGALYWFETPNLAVEISGYLTLGGSVGIEAGGRAQEFVAPELSILYLTSKGDICPYFGGGVGFGIIALQTDVWDTGTGYGVSFNGGGGVVFLRTYDIRVLLDVRYRINLAEVEVLWGDEEQIKGPHQCVMFSLGFTYTPRTGGCCGGGGCF
jgi:TolB-like protein